ncbi:NAD(P)/FAD-dependent oxidoreductase [Vibrio salinus]|uniref:NAD(P)/FAD-dependent oxidoreductase n=1 Tax=Vibrio salinus TaxID=2899784 RepID=UPI001E656921|nr:FAD-binding oxidoreductase [Vibrio salinus]MCE0494816.1 FAD-binding oxidoreductase [Vibrio salinus]
MIKTLEYIDTPNELPKSTSIVIIGGGIVGVSAALTLAERNIPVVLIEKGFIAAEQSARNLGWIRKTNRHHDDIPLALAADKLWASMSERVGCDVDYKQSGIMFLSSTEEYNAVQEAWLESVKDHNLDSRLLSSKEIDDMVPRGKGSWKGGLYTKSDGRAEPSIATSAMAKAAIKKGAVIVQNCAVRTLSKSGGKVSGVITEKGEIQCDQVLLASGAWSRRFLGNQGISIPALHLICSVLRTKPMSGPTDISVAGPDFSFRKHLGGGFVIMQRGAIEAPLTLDHLLIGHRYLSQLKEQGSALRISLGKHFIKDLRVPRRWSGESPSFFENIRIMDPEHNPALNQEALTNLRNAWPEFNSAQIDEEWAGLIDVTPDSKPIIDHVDKLQGLTIATGFSGHGFGTGPAAGHLAADLVSGVAPIIDPSPYRLGRF